MRNANKLIGMVTVFNLVSLSSAWAKTSAEWMDIAQKAEADKNYRSMVRAYKRAAKDPLIHDKAIVDMAGAILKAGDVKTTIALIGKYVSQENPFSIKGQMIYAEAMRLSGNYSAALKALDVVHKIRPGYPIASEVRGMVFFDARQFDDAVANLSAYLTENPDSIRARNARAHAYFELNRMEEAADDFKALAKQEPNKTENWVFLGDSYSGLRQRVAAREAYNHAKALEPMNSTIYEKLATLAEKFPDAPETFEEQVALYKKSIELNPRNFEAGQHLANLYYEHKMLNLALAEYKREVDLDFSFDPGMKGMIHVMSANAHWDEMGPILSSYTDRFPERTWASVQYTKILLSISQFTLAKRVIDRNRSATDSNVESPLMLANWYQAQGQSKEALQVLMDADKKFPKQAMVQFNIAMLQESLGNLPDAIAKYREVATSNDPRLESKSQVNLAMVLEHAGRTTEAWQTLKTLKTKISNKEVLTKKIAELEKELSARDAGHFQDRMPAAQHLIPTETRDGSAK